MRVRATLCALGLSVAAVAAPPGLPPGETGYQEPPTDPLPQVEPAPAPVRSVLFPVQDGQRRLFVAPESIHNYSTAQTIRLSASPGGPVVATSLATVVAGFPLNMPRATVETIFRNAGAVGEVRPLTDRPGFGRNVFVGRAATALEAFEVAARIASQGGRHFFAHPDVVLEVRFLGTIEDPLYPDQWHLRNRGVGGAPVGFDLGAEAAWAATLGEGATVALFDGPVQPDHPDYADNVVATIRNTFSDSPAPVGHGTAMAGLIAARDNDIGGRGIAPRAQLVIADITDASVADIAAMWYAADDVGADVICNAWSPQDFSMLPEVLLSAIEDLEANGRGGLGAVFVVGVGRESVAVPFGTPLAPLAQTFAVGAINNRGRLPDQNYGPWVDAVSPTGGGTLQMTTTDVVGPLGFSPDDYTTGFTGPSAGTALASGVAALVLSVNPDLTAAQVRRILREAGRRPTESSGIFIANNRPFNFWTEFSDSFGYGSVDAGRATSRTLDTLQTPGLSWPAPVEHAHYTYDSAGSVMLYWQNPPHGPQGEYARAMVVRFTGSHPWRPTDGEVYEAGQTVGEGVEIVAVGDMSAVIDPTRGAGDNLFYTVYAVNEADRYSFARIVRKPRDLPFLVLLDSGESVSAWQMSGDWSLGAPELFTVRGRGIDGAVTTFPMPPALAGFNLPPGGTNLLGTRLEGVYSSNLRHWLLSPPIDLTRPDLTDARVSFLELVDIEGNGRDWLTIEVVTDTGLFDPGLEVLATLVFEDQSLAFDWRRRSFDLTPFLGERVRIRWTLEPDRTDAPDLPGQMGVYVDDLMVTANCPPGLCTDLPPTPPLPSPFPPPPPPPPPEPIGPLPQLISIPIQFFIGGPQYRPAGSSSANADTNGDGVVDFADLTSVLREFGAADPSRNADTNGDGRVDLRDIVTVLEHFGRATDQR